jgi:hypothetical protein
VAVDVAGVEGNVVAVVLIAICVVFVVALVVVNGAVACSADVTVLVDMLVILVDNAV